jgi:hypothetical protein
MTALEEAHAFQQLTAAGYDLAKIAAMCGRSPEYIGYRIDLLGLVPPAREALDKGHLPVGTAWYVCRLPADVQHRFLTKWARGEFPTARDAEAYAQACRTVSTQDTLLLLEEPSAADREQLAIRRRQVTTRIDQLGKAGEILSDLARMTPEELVKLLAGAPGGVDAYRTRIDHVRNVAAKAVTALRKASALAAAATLDINPDARPAA